MQHYLQAIITVLSLVNPAICALMFSRLEAGRPTGKQFADATRAASAVLAILILAALFGAQVLHQFGVSLDAFEVAGGGVLAWMGFAMLSGKSVGAPASGAGGQDPSLTSLILFAASPGTITGVITVAVNHARLGVPVTAVIAVCVAVLVTWAVMVAVARFGGHERPSFLRDVVSRFMGLIVVAMGVQFALIGIRSYFQGSET